MEKHVKMDDLGVPLFLETPVSIPCFFSPRFEQVVVSDLEVPAAPDEVFFVGEGWSNKTPGER